MDLRKSKLTPPASEIGGGIIVTVTMGDTTQAEYTPNNQVHLIGTAPEAKQMNLRRFGALTLAIFLGVGVPVGVIANMQTTRIIDDSLSPAQKDLREQLRQAKEDLQAEMNTAVDQAGEEFKTDMQTHIDETIEQIFAPIIGEPQPEDQTTTTSTTVPPQE